MHKITILAASIVGFALAWNNGEGLKPPMGWNSEKVYGCNISESIVMDTAAYMAKVRLNDTGYVYLNLGDCW